jgi:hypothetical protein
MYAQQYPDTNQVPPPYQENMQVNQQLDNYYRPADERMADFQRLVARYESRFKINMEKKKDFLIII